MRKTALLAFVFLTGCFQQPSLRRAVGPLGHRGQDQI